jgi:hypothetical protein
MKGTISSKRKSLCLYYLFCRRSFTRPLYTTFAMASIQRPQITCPDPFHLTTIRQLTKDRIDEVAHSSQNRALISGSFGRMRFAECSLQRKA